MTKSRYRPSATAKGRIGFWAGLGDFAVRLAEYQPKDKNGKRLRLEYIPCRRDAIIYLHSAASEIPALQTPRLKNARRIVREVPGCTLELANGKAVVCFPAGKIEQVAKIARAKKKRGTR